MASSDMTARDMAIGLSTYAFFWRSSAAAPRPLGLREMLDETASLGANVFQICDYPAIESLPAAELRAVREHAVALGVTLELGTRGIAPERLELYRELAAALDVRFVRSMLRTKDHQPSPAEAVALLQAELPRYRDQGLTLGLETYEQVPTRDLVDVVRAVASPHLGVCLDPGNCVARLETPDYVISEVAPYVVNMHVKDFAFTRAEGWVGFSLTGCLLGQGLLDYDGLIQAVRPDEKGISQVVEHWLPRSESMEETCRSEQEWTRHSVEFLLARAGETASPATAS
jgi:3-oxoisoapionate decarboxylase